MASEVEAQVFTKTRPSTVNFAKTLRAKMSSKYLPTQPQGGYYV
jgi:hypothetical protein